jgi:perosamine synthetase
MIPVMKPWLGEEEARAAAEAVASGWVAQGPRVQAFEDAVRDWVGAAHGVAVSSCTTALHLSLVLLGIGPDDEVVVPSLSFIATANVARYVGARPVFADVEPGTLNLSADTVKQVLSPRTRAVILVHQGGMPADVEAVHDLCDPLGVAVVEDAACALGSTYRGRPVGAGSDLVAFSFHPRKVITTGEGGMVMTSRADWAERLRRLREHGMNLSAAARHAAAMPVLERYLEVGYNYRMTDIQAAVGLVQLGRLDAIVARRRELAARYRELLAGVPGVGLPGDPAHGTTNFQSFWIELADDFPLGRDELLEWLMADGISARRGIMAAHLEPAYADAAGIELPVTERLTRRSLILPLFHAMTAEEQDQVVAVVREVAAGAGR